MYICMYVCMSFAIIHAIVDNDSRYCAISIGCTFDFSQLSIRSVRRSDDEGEIGLWPLTVIYMPGLRKQFLP